MTDLIKHYTLQGKMSTFGGPNDKGVSPSEDLALYDRNDAKTHPFLFLAKQPPRTAGAARRLNPNIHYIATRWDYHVTPRGWLKTHQVKVTNPLNGLTALAYPVDWGPNIDTGRVADLSPALAEHLGLETNNAVVVEVPLPPTDIQVRHE